MWKVSGMTGKKHTEESKRKISKSKSGVKRGSPSQETREKIRKAHIGMKHSTEARLKQSTAKKGEKHPRWRGGISTVNNRIRSSLEYRLWRKAVVERDKYICIWCGSKEKIHADHIKPFALFPELRFAIDNGRTLCEKCHRKTDTYGGVINN